MITVKIPREKALAMLTEEISRIRGLTLTLDFNFEHNQVDLMEAHLASIQRSAVIAEELRAALKP